MDLQLDATVAQMYHSASQKARVLTEAWVTTNLYCPVCGHMRMEHFPNNAEVADFYCPACDAQYELKSKNGKIGKRVADGAYDTFLERISNNSGPDFLFMSYRLESMQVHGLCFVPKFFFVPEIVEKRKPLGEHARRRGWTGCNILYGEIPEQGRIDIIRQGVAVEKEQVVARVQEAYAMQVDDLEMRGWLFDVLNCVNAVRMNTFTLEEMYRFEGILGEKHPENQNVRPKIRQQLQILRDRGVIEFLGNGRYRKA